MKHIVKIEIDNKRYGIPEEVFNYIRQCCNKINELEEENKELQQRIDKAIEYIEERFEYNEETGEYTLKATFDKCSVYELYKILKRGIIC